MGVVIIFNTKFLRGLFEKINLKTAFQKRCKTQYMDTWGKNIPVVERDYADSLRQAPVCSTETKKASIIKAQ